MGERKLVPSVFTYTELPFHQILIGGKQAVDKTIIFRPRENLSPQDIKIGEYRAVFAFWKSPKGKATILDERHYLIRDNEMIEHLREGSRLGPRDIDLDKVRDQDLPSTGFSWIARRLRGPNR